MWRARLLAKVLDSDTLASKEKDKSYSYGSKRQAEGLRRRGATSGLLSFSKALSSMSLLVSSALCYGLPYMPPPPSVHLDNPEKCVMLHTSPVPLICPRLSFYTPKQPMLGFTAAGYYLSFGDLLIHIHEIKKF